MNAFEITNLTKKFSKETVIENLSFNVKQGENTCLFAPSGAGKSSFIRILSGLDKNYQGNVKTSAKKIITILQEPSLFWYQTVKENICLPFKFNHSIWDKNLYNQWMELTGLQEYENHFPDELSGGMKQKVSIIRSLMQKPELLLMDEAFKSIDLNSKMEIIEFIKQEYRSSTILFVTHTLDEIPQIASKILKFEHKLSSHFTELYLDDMQHDMQKLYEFIWGKNSA